jgi:hypothetical protein
MPLPKVEKFEQLLASISVTRPSPLDLWKEFVAVPKRQVNLDGRRSVTPSISFWYREQSDLGLDKLLGKIVSSLEEANHPANLQLAGIALAIYAYCGRSDGSAVDQFNLLFAEIVSGDLTQFVLLRDIDLPDYRFDVGPFSIGPFDPNGLAYRCNKSGSDFFPRYEQQIRRMPFSVERKFKPVPVVFWHRLVGCGPIEWPEPPKWPVRQGASFSVVTQAIDEYFAAISELQFKRFFEELRKVQEVPIALGSGWLELDSLTALLGSFEVSVFLNLGGQQIGFVCPRCNFDMSVNLGGANLGVPFTEKYLREHLLFESFGNFEVHRQLETFSHFLALGRLHESERRLAEGFLHHVIALDLLLGAAEASTASVSSRCAVLAHRAMGKTFEVLSKEVREIYSARSKYVHEGLPPKVELMPLVQELTREVTFCLLRLQRAEHARKAGFNARWKRDIDFVQAALEAQRPLADDDWRRIGAYLPGDPNYTDYSEELKFPAQSEL